MSAIIRVHKNICDTSVREIRIASGELESARVVATCTCTASYSVDKSTKSATVQEFNVTATINGMQKYLELPIRKGEEKENNPAPIKGKNQLQHLDIPRCQQRAYWTVMYMYTVTIELELS